MKKARKKIGDDNNDDDSETHIMFSRYIVIEIIIIFESNIQFYSISSANQIATHRQKIILNF